MVLKRTVCLFSPVRAYVVMVGVTISSAVLIAGVEVAAVSGVISVALGVSPSSSGLVSVKGTFVDTPLGYQYLYPCEHSITILLFALNFFSNWR